MKKCLLLGFALVALIQPAVRADFITDGGFENATGGTSPNPSSYAYNPTDGTGPLNSWGFAGASGFVTAGSAFGNPTPTGSKAAFVQYNVNQVTPTGTGVPGDISQSFTAAAGSYVLTFSAASRAGYPQSAFLVTIDSIVVATIRPTTTASFTNYTFNVTLAGTNHLIDFSALNGANGADTTSFIDNVSLNASAVPEPGSLTLLGLGAVTSLGALARRNRRGA